MGYSRFMNVSFVTHNVIPVVTYVAVYLVHIATLLIVN